MSILSKAKGWYEGGLEWKGVPPRFFSAILSPSAIQALRSIRSGLGYNFTVLPVFAAEYTCVREPIRFRSASSRRLVLYTLRTGPGYVASLRSLVTSVIPSTIA